MAAAQGVSAADPKVVAVAPERFAAAAAETIAQLIDEVVAARGRCRLALAGGGTPAPVYAAMAEPPVRERVTWGAIDWFWGDERAVPPDDPGSNYAMARRTLLEPLGIDGARIHRIRGELGAAAAAADYADTLGDAPLDVVLLGMGGDGHTASLFPASPGPDGGDAHVCATTSPVAPHDRISLTMSAINGAGAVVLLATGAGKAARLAEVRAQQRAGDPTLPAARVQPARGVLIWLLDTAAAEHLEDLR